MSLWRSLNSGQSYVILVLLRVLKVLKWFIIPPLHQLCLSIAICSGYLVALRLRWYIWIRLIEVKPTFIFCSTRNIGPAFAFWSLFSMLHYRKIPLLLIWAIVLLWGISALILFINSRLTWKCDFSYKRNETERNLTSRSAWIWLSLIYFQFIIFSRKNLFSPAKCQAKKWRWIWLHLDQQRGVTKYHARNV